MQTAGLTNLKYSQPHQWSDCGWNYDFAHWWLQYLKMPMRSELREGSLALGATRIETTLRVMIQASLSGIFGYLFWHCQERLEKMA